MERKIQEYSVVFLMEGETFKLRNLPSRTSPLLCSAANWVGTSLEFDIVRLVPSGFFRPQPWYLRRSEHIFPGETPAC